MSPVVENPYLEDDDNTLPAESIEEAVNHAVLGTASRGSSLKDADNQSEGFTKPIDFDSPEMSGWRIDPSQSNWGVNTRDSSSRDDGDEDVAKILSMDVNPASTPNSCWPAGSTNHRTFYY
jgi:hypothetical protein